MRREAPRAPRRRVPLMMSFGVVSLTLTVALYVVLDVRIRQSVAARSVATLTQTTQSALAITINTLLSGPAYGTGGIPATGAQQQAQAGAISASARTLVANSDIVAVEAVLSDGTVIGGANAPPVGTKLPSDAGFRAALTGVKHVRMIATESSSATAVERPLLRRYGDLLVLEQGVRLTPGGPILAMVRSYAELGPTRRQAAADNRSIAWVLALGLLVFWLALYRIVVSASRSLTRHARANTYLATHDALTGLPNRELLRDRTERAVLASRRSGSRVALLLMDLDRFREINDTFGHPIGDLLLSEISSRIQAQLRDSDTVARVGGDEFVVMLPDLRSAEMAFVIAEKLIAAVQQPFVLDDATVDIDGSIGLATTPDDGADFDELLQHADIAMYLAKHDSLGVAAYAPELDVHSPARLTVLTDLRRAVERPDEIVVYYQPQADLATGEITGVEALVRWRHPERGMIPPDEFVPLAENTGIIRPLTWRVLRAALEQNHQWAQAGLRLRVSVNISARSLLDAGFTDNVGRLLTETGVPAERLELELTETTIVANPDRPRDILQDLAARGIGLSIDDFGTGYSSMARLKNLPVDEIKIDRSFVSNMNADPSDAAIVRSILELARSLHLSVVAEGVETADVRRQLADLGCTTMQGYFLSRPLPADEFSRWMTTKHAIAERI